MSRAKRGGTSAVTAEGMRGGLRRNLLHHYDHDPEFTAALEQLWVERAERLSLTLDWRVTPPLIWIEEPSRWVVREQFEAWAERLPEAERAPAWNKHYEPLVAYFEAVSDLAERFGLDRLGPEGFGTIHLWCAWRRELGAGWTARRFSDVYQNFGAVPVGGEPFEYEVGVVDLGGQPFKVVEQGLRPVLRIAGKEVVWDPTLRRRSDAFSWLRKEFGKGHEPEIRSELDRLEAEAEAVGARAYDTRPRVARDIEWLFWHLRYRDGPAAVAQRAGLDEDAVPKITMAVGRVAKDAEIALRPGWSTWTGERSAASKWVS
jgi:hypothetical protein